MHWAGDLEYELMGYCLKQEGCWWACHAFRNQEVNSLYGKLRGQPLKTVLAILSDGGPNYIQYIQA